MSFWSATRSGSAGGWRTTFSFVSSAWTLAKPPRETTPSRSSTLGSWPPTSDRGRPWLQVRLLFAFSPLFAFDLPVGQMSTLPPESHKTSSDLFPLWHQQLWIIKLQKVHLVIRPSVVIASVHYKIADGTEYKVFNLYAKVILNHSICFTTLQKLFLAWIGLLIGSEWLKNYVTTLSTKITFLAWS